VSEKSLVGKSRDKVKELEDVLVTDVVAKLVEVEEAVEENMMGL
jgi:hypothetical protein